MTEMLTTPLVPEAAGIPEAPPEDVEGLAIKSISPRRMAFRRFLSHKPAVIATVVLIMMIIFVVLAPITARYGVNEAVFASGGDQGSNRYLPPQSIAWFGTDEIGRDLYSRLIYGTRVSLVIGLAAAIISTVIGTAVGAYAGMRGGWFDDVMMRVTDLFIAFPFLVALLVMRNMLGELDWVTAIIGERTSVSFIIVLLAVFTWMPVARVVRGQVLALKEREFIEASRALGSSTRRIILRHLLPNAIGPILVALTFSVVVAIIAESTLGFFGYGPQAGAGDTSLGILVGSAKANVLTGNWWMVVFPCGVLLLVALTINFFGDGLRDAADPKLVRH
jgi:ABC-type dipeptide/oligopeptide/nickel transport system permease subunit